MSSRERSRLSLARPHSHPWVVGILGLLAGLVLLIYVPTLKVVSNSILLFAGFHLLGAAVIAASAYIGWFRGVRQAWALKASSSPIYSTGLAALNAPALFSVLFLAAAVLLQINRPGLWPVSFLLVVNSVTFFAGSRVADAFRTAQDAVLPLVDIGLKQDARMLDIGCGSGRSTIPLARADRGLRVVAFDDFESDRAAALTLLQRNLKATGLEDRISVTRGALIPLPFPDQSFDAAISVNVLDHRGGDHRRALAEVFRILRPGGRMLLVVRTPSLATFAALHVFAFMLAGPKHWRRATRSAGLGAVLEGRINNAWFIVLERPATE